MHGQWTKKGISVCYSFEHDLKLRPKVFFVSLFIALKG